MKKIIMHLSMFVLLGTTNAQIRIDDFHGFIIPSWCTLDRTSKYTLSSGGDSIFPIMNSNHQLEHTINLPRRWECTACYFVDMDYPGGHSYGYFTQNLFNEDGLYEYFSFNNGHAFEIKNEEGQILHTLSPREGLMFVNAYPTIYRYGREAIIIQILGETSTTGELVETLYKMDMSTHEITRIGSRSISVYDTQRGIIPAQYTASGKPYFYRYANNRVDITNTELENIHTFNAPESSTVWEVQMNDLDNLQSINGHTSTFITQTLFNNDSKYEYFNINGYNVEVKNEDGAILYTFDCSGNSNYRPASIRTLKMSGYYILIITGYTSNLGSSAQWIFKIDTQTHSHIQLGEMVYGGVSLIPVPFNDSENILFCTNSTIYDINFNPTHTLDSAPYRQYGTPFCNADASNGGFDYGLPINWTQTLFNDDNLYERAVRYGSHVDIINENGDILHTFYLDDEFESFYSDCKIIKYGGKYYFVLSESDNDFIFARRTIWYLMDIPTQSLTRVDEPLPIIAYPTMASREQIITVELEENNETMEVQIINSLGHVEMVVPVQSGQNKVQLHINDLQSGMYIIRTRSRNGQQTNKIIVK